MNDSFPYKEKYCEDCAVHFLVSDGRKDKWLCCGITKAEYRKSKNIPPDDVLRFCVRKDFDFVAKEYFQLNLNKREVETIINNFQTLLKRKQV